MEIRYPWRTGRPHSGPPPCWASQCGSQASAPFSPSLMSPLKQKNVIPFFDYISHVLRVLNHHLALESLLQP